MDPMQYTMVNAGHGPHVSRKEAAALLGVSMPTVDRYLSKGLLPRYVAGNRVSVRILRSDIDEFLRLRLVPNK